MKGRNLPNVVSNTRCDSDVLTKVASWPAYPSLDELTHKSVGHVVAIHGIDFATALIFDRLCKSPGRAGTFAGMDGTDQCDADSTFDVAGEELPSQLAIVPGAFYCEKRHRGADGHLIREEAEKLGISTALIPTRSFGFLDENAAIIREWLSRHASAETVLVSLSKGGADLKWAMHRYGDDDAIQQLAGWINVSGITEGSALVEWLQNRPLRSALVRLLFWSRGYDFRVIRELSFGQGSPLSCPWRVPESCPLIHIVGFPLQKHLSSGLMRRGHRRVAAISPNDGAGILLLEAIRRPGTVFPIWGVDHYLHRDELELRTLFRQMLLHVARQRRMVRMNQVPQGVSP